MRNFINKGLYLMYFQLAWRNIWRNPRRTVVILLAVVIGAWNMIFAGALMRGVEVGMIKNNIATLTGNIQIHLNGYRNDPVIENSITDPETVEGAIEKILPAEARWTSRVRVSAVASNARHSSGVTLAGIDPSREAEISFIGSAVTQGRYLAPDDAHGRAFRIIGIFRAEMKSTEKRFVFVTKSAAQQMLKLKNGVSEFCIVLPNRLDNNPLVAALQSSLSASRYEVSTWRDLLPVLNAYLKLSDGFIYIWYVVIFIAMGFGIVNTTLMAVFERMREFGLLKALGIKPLGIIKGVLTEAFLILLIGMFIGNFLGFLSVLALSGSGIDLSALAAGAEFAGMSRILYPLIYPKDVIVANLVVFTLGLLVSLYPAVKAARFTPVEALSQT
jgi:ABC-type lipoprotein release transport system permease subunit